MGADDDRYCSKISISGLLDFTAGQVPLLDPSRPPCKVGSFGREKVCAAVATKGCAMAYLESLGGKDLRLKLLAIFDGRNPSVTSGRNIRNRRQRLRNHTERRKTLP